MPPQDIIADCRTEFFFRLDRQCQTPAPRLEKNLNPLMNTEQLEIGLPSQRLNPAKRKRQLRAARARWWFGRMHAVVESAGEWTPPVRRPTTPSAAN